MKGNSLTFWKSLSSDRGSLTQGPAVGALGHRTPQCHKVQSLDCRPGAGPAAGRASQPAGSAGEECGPDSWVVLSPYKLLLSPQAQDKLSYMMQKAGEAWRNKT